jgi:hypothetical protein
MTVAQLINELQRLPQHLPVKIETGKPPELIDNFEVYEIEQDYNESYVCIETY